MRGKLSGPWALSGTDCDSEWKRNSDEACTSESERFSSIPELKHFIGATNSSYLDPSALEGLWLSGLALGEASRVDDKVLKHEKETSSSVSRTHRSKTREKEKSHLDAKDREDIRKTRSRQHGRSEVGLHARWLCVGYQHVWTSADEPRLLTKSWQSRVPKVVKALRTPTLTRRCPYC